jgi:hypothetical protein
LEGISLILKTTQGDSPSNALFKTLEDLRKVRISFKDMSMFLDCAKNYFEIPSIYGRPQLIETIKHVRIGQITYEEEKKESYLQQLEKRIRDSQKEV